jgi:MFS transporter, DHA2 family, multidrug resistance protein
VPAAATGASRASVVAGVVAAHKLGSLLLPGLVRAAFVHGMDAALWVCGGIGLAGMLLGLVFPPWRIRH